MSDYALLPQRLRAVEAGIRFMGAPNAREALLDAADAIGSLLAERDALRSALREWLRLYDAPKDSMPGRAYTEHLREVRTCVETTRALLLSREE